MNRRGIATQLTQYAVLAVGQAVIGMAVAEGTRKVAEWREERRRAKSQLGFKQQHVTVGSTGSRREVLERLRQQAAERRTRRWGHRG